MTYPFLLTSAQTLYCGGLSFLETNADMNPLNEQAHTINDSEYTASCELTKI